MDVEITLSELLAEQEKALQEFARVANAIIDHQIKTNKIVVETLQLQKKVLLNQ